MDWRLRDDPHNPQNRVAGNGGDLVKHTVYLTTLRHLGGRALHVRECHGGRGAYRQSVVRQGEPRRSWRELGDACLLSRVQNEVLAALELPRDGSWYAGSAALDAWVLRDAHRHEIYEYEPTTRAILRAVLDTLATGSSAVEADGTLDGETYIADRIAGWTSRDVVLLDPFTLWRQKKLAYRRARYRRIVDQWVELESRPALVWFWTWGASVPSIDAFLAGHGHSPRDGYADLERALARDGTRWLRVRWSWDLPCVMWVLCDDVSGLDRSLHQELDALLDAFGVSVQVDTVVR